MQAGPWGEPLEGDFKKAVFGFTGHSFEPKLAMWSAMHRYLDSRQGRWIQRDPLGDLDSQNRYQYGLNSPLSNVDPNGLATFRGEFPSGWQRWRLRQVVERVAEEFANPQSKCAESESKDGKAKCQVCPACDYKALLDSKDLVLRYDPNSPNRGETANDKPIITFGPGALTDDARFRLTLIHELTHICKAANLGNSTRVDHWDEPYRYMHFVEKDLNAEVNGLWTPICPCTGKAPVPGPKK